MHQMENTVQYGRAADEKACWKHMKARGENQSASPLGENTSPKSPSSLTKVWRVWSASFSENVEVAWCLKEQEVKLKPGQVLRPALFVAYYTLIWRPIATYSPFL